VVISTPTYNQFFALSSFGSSTISGSATDNGGVTAVTVKLYRNRTRDGSNVREIWDGTSFSVSPTQTQVPTTLSGPVTNRTWNFDTNFPTVDKLDAGTYYLWAYATDAAGNTNYARSAFTLVAPDTQKPVVAVTTPTMNQKLATTAFVSGAVTGTATDNVGVSSVKVKLYRKRNNINQFWDGAAFVTTSTVVSAELTGSNWSLSNVPGQELLDNGLYSLVAYAYDAAGNVGASTVVNFTLSNDFTAPSVSISTPTSNQQIDINSFGSGVITGLAADNIGVTQVKLKLVRKRGTLTEFWNGSSFSTTSALVNATVSSASLTLSGVSVNWSYDTPISASQLDNGVYSVYAYAYDEAGNSKATLSRNFNVSGSIAFGATSATGSSAGGS
jgi:hypothetical protein